MDEEFEPKFGRFFDVMKYLGFWVIESKDSGKKFLYFMYSAAMSSLVAFMCYMGYLDLVASIPDLDKVFFNTSINPFMMGIWGKYFFAVLRAERINSLRRRLSRSVKTCKDAEELEIYHAAVCKLKFVIRLLSFFFAWAYPTWMVVSLGSEYLMGERQLPIPARWPGDIDLADTRVFISIWLFHGLFAVFFLSMTLCLEISMFGLLIQISREYSFLIKRIREFGEYCDDAFSADGVAVVQKKTEINRFLKRAAAKQMLGQIIGRQKQIITFTEDLEYSYQSSMFIHIFVGGAFLVVNGVNTMIVSSTFSVKMGYQYAFVLAMLCDMLYLCWLSTRISTQCFEVGTAFYSIPWYKMDVDIQKDIILVILRTQKPPRITAGNFVILSLPTFMGMLKNIYSWLALFRQVAVT